MTFTHVPYAYYPVNKACGKEEYYIKRCENEGGCPAADINLLCGIVNVDVVASAFIHTAVISAVRVGYPYKIGVIGTFSAKLFITGHSETVLPLYKLLFVAITLLPSVSMIWPFIARLKPENRESRVS